MAKLNDEEKKRILDEYAEEEYKRIMKSEHDEYEIMRQLSDHYLGAVASVKSYDNSKGTKFSSYAFKNAHHEEIKGKLLDKGYEMMSPEIYKAVKQYRQLKEKNVPDDEIMKIMGISRKKLSDVSWYAHSSYLIRLDETNDDGDPCWELASDESEADWDRNIMVHQIVKRYIEAAAIKCNLTVDVIYDIFDSKLKSKDLKILHGFNQSQRNKIKKQVISYLLSA